MQTHLDKSKFMCEFSFSITYFRIVLHIYFFALYENLTFTSGSIPTSATTPNAYYAESFSYNFFYRSINQVNQVLGGNGNSIYASDVMKPKPNFESLKL